MHLLDNNFLVILMVLSINYVPARLVFYYFIPVYPRQAYFPRRDIMQGSG